MPPKTKTIKQILKDRPPYKKWVRRANMWLLRSVVEGKESIEWVVEEPKI